MRSALRTLILAPALLAAAALATSTAQAETVLKVPFNFTVAGQDCPAGLYSLERDITANLITLRSKDGTRVFTWVIGPGDPDPKDTRISLKFAESGQAHTLKLVQYGNLVARPFESKAKRAEH